MRGRITIGSFRGKLRDLQVGLYHGSYCVGCCWGVMVVLIVLGVMNLAVMVGLAAVILVEKTWRHGRRFGLAIGVVLLGLACAVPSHPGLVPGVVDAGQQMMSNSTTVY